MTRTIAWTNRTTNGIVPSVSAKLESQPLIQFIQPMKITPENKRHLKAGVSHSANRALRLSFAAAILLPCQAWAVDWDGGGGSDTLWTNPLNWAGDVVPEQNVTASYNAGIRGSYVATLDAAVPRVQGVAVGSANGNNVTLYIRDGANLDSYGSITLGNANGMGYVYQTGGVAKQSAASSSVIKVDTGSLYEISGGSLDNARGFTLNGTFRVVGSKATGAGEVAGTPIKIASSAMTFSSTAKLEFLIDDGGVTALKSTATAANTTLGGTLAMGIKGGVALTTANSFKVLDFANQTHTNWFATMPNAALWETPSDLDAAGDLSVSFAAEANKGTLAHGAVDPIAFTAATAGDITLTGLTVSDTLNLYLDVNAGTGKTVDNLLSYFSTNGITASAVSLGDYDVALSFTPTAATSYFAWDLSSFNSNATISGITLTAVPEPSTMAFAGMAGCSMLAFGLRRRLKATN